ncbi:uncharacterized protein LOC119738275 [Patiria miniata]|uniref:Uncharacterized protein n=1 Tax=Patiria miniata TaxID=46514 RepID=A0A914AY20_PATMI|nr:uncharacterized protein LOC119738275 [Patiria miniata]
MLRLDVTLLCLVSFSAAYVQGLEHIPLTLNVESGLQEIPCGEFKYYAVEVTDPCRDLRVRVNKIEGEPDLYVSRGYNKFPTDSSLAWTSYEWGSEKLVISSWDPEFEVGMFYIGVHAYCGIDVETGNTPSKVTVLAESIPTTHPHSEITVDTPFTGEKVSAEGYNYYRFCLPSQCTDVEVKLVNCLSSQDCPYSYGYPELLVSRSIVQPTIKDHSWKLASLDRRSIVMKHDNPDVSPGHHYVAVYGWCTPDEFCSDKSTCGPCDYYANMTYDVSVVMTDVGDCSGAANFMPSSLVVCLAVFLMKFFF